MKDDLDLDLAAQAAASDAIREMNRHFDIQRGAAELMADLMKANPQFSENTINVARAILESHPKINKMSGSYGVLLPYIMSVAHDIEIEIDRRLPEEWSNGKRQESTGSEAA